MNGREVTYYSTPRSLFKRKKKIRKNKKRKFAFIFTFLLLFLSTRLRRLLSLVPLFIPIENTPIFINSVNLIIVLSSKMANGHRLDTKLIDFLAMMARNIDSWLRYPL